MHTVPSRWIQAGPVYKLCSIRRVTTQQLRSLTSSPIPYRDSNARSKTTFPGFAPDAMDVPLQLIQSRTPTIPAPSPPVAQLVTDEEERLAKVRIVFGSEPGQRRRKIEAASTVIAGIAVPPKPEEPDNCCMSGCVNCVWDQFREEFEEWAAKSAEARAKLQELLKMSGNVADSTEEDGGGSTGLWLGDDAQSEGADLFADIPVGIREFMKTEKKLKERRAQAQTVSA